METSGGKNLASYSGKLGGQGDREICERTGRGKEKAAGGDDKSS
jgi:hypothetical protein